MKSSTDKRSPLKEEPLRQAGDSLSKQIEEVIENEWIKWVFVALTVLFLAMFEWYRLAIGDRPTLFSAILYSIGGIVAAMYAAYRIFRSRRKLRALKLGLQGEKVVGRTLDKICLGRGDTVLHDFIADGFNIDHIVISANGIFTINTKTISKPNDHDAQIIYDGASLIIDGHKPDRDPIKQAQAERDHIRSVLSKLTGHPESAIPVRPVVLCPGWYIKGKSTRKEVWVLTPEGFSAFLEHEEIRISPEAVALYAERLMRENRQPSS